MFISTSFIVQIQIGNLPHPHYLVRISESATTTSNSVFDAQLFTMEEAQEAVRAMRETNARCGTQNEQIHMRSAAAMIAESIGAELVDIRLSQYDHGDIRGLPDAELMSSSDEEDC